MKIVFMGCVEFSVMTLEHLLSIEHDNVQVVGVITRKSSPFNTDFSSLVPLAEKNDIPYFLAEGNDQDAMLNWVKVCLISIKLWKRKY